MTPFSELIFALFLLVSLRLAGASRLKHCITAAAVQGVLTALYPLASWDWKASFPPVLLILIAVLTLAVKAVLLPALLVRAMRKAQVKRELEPLAGYPLSTFLVLLFSAGMFFLCEKYRLAPDGVSMLAVPSAFTAVFTGLFIIMSRKKAITQSIGFLFFENGITLFGMGMKLEYGFLVELGILLDVLALVFIMGIAVFQISREFSHIDSDQMHLLNDRCEKER